MKLLYANMRANSQYRYIVSRISLPASAKIVELGCATGNLLYLFKKRGCTTLGVELGESSSRYASNRYGLTVWNMDIDRALDRVGSGIDLIIFSHTFEHLTNPEEILVKCSRVLNKGGVLFIELPNSYIGAQKGDRWTEFSTILLNSDHIYNFSSLNMGIFLPRCGFKIRDVACFLAQKQVPILKRLGLNTKVDHIYKKKQGILSTYAPLLLNTLYLAGRYWGRRDTIAAQTNSASWSGTDEWMRFLATNG